MKHLSKIALTALTIGSLAFTLKAQDDVRPGRGGMNRPGPGMVPPLIKALDADKDGTLSAVEIAATPSALLTLDADKDGSLSREELRPQRPEGAPETASADRPERPEGDRPPMHGDRGPRGDRQGGPRPGGHPIIGALDANHDGVIDASEIANAPTALKALSQNDDGSIDLKALRPARQEGGDTQGHGPRGPGGARGPQGE